MRGKDNVPHGAETCCANQFFGVEVSGCLRVWCAKCWFVWGILFDNRRSPSGNHPNATVSFVKLTYILVFGSSSGEEISTAILS